MWRSMTCSRESLSWLALARLKLINNASNPGMNNLAFMRNLARFDSGITNLSPEMPNLASTRADVLSRFVIFFGGSLNMPELSVVLNEFNNVGMKVEGALIKVVIVDLATALATFLRCEECSSRYIARRTKAT
jgi:hypothetical protein